MKKTTFEIYYNLIPKFFLSVLFSANLVSAADKCAFFSNGTVGISLLKTPLYEEALLHRCFDTYLLFQENACTSAKKRFLLLEVKIVAMGLFAEIKNLHEVFYNQKSLFFGVNGDGYVFVTNDQTERERRFTSLVSPKDECNSGLESEGTNAHKIKNFMLSH